MFQRAQLEPHWLVGDRVGCIRTAMRARLLLEFPETEAAYRQPFLPS